MEANHVHRGRLIDHVHLVVRDPDAGRRFYRAALDAFVRDPDGNNIEAVWHGPHRRSAPSVRLS